MKYLNQYTGQFVEVELPAKKVITGKLVEFGVDVLVVYTGLRFFYIPASHIVSIKKSDNTENEIINMAPSPIDNGIEQLSFKKTLDNAIGKFMEINFSGNQSVFGYITHIKDDYLVFYSPAYKNMLISLNHLKWLVPHLDKAPYAITAAPDISPGIQLADTFKDQCSKLTGEVILFNLANDTDRIGVITKIEKNMVELITGNEKILYLNFSHIKSIHGFIL